MEEEEEEELVCDPYKTCLEDFNTDEQTAQAVLSALWHLQETEKEGAAWLGTSTLLVTSTT